MPCQQDIITYYSVKAGARFDLCVSGDAEWVGDAKVICSDPATPNLDFDADQLRTACGEAGGAQFVTVADRTYLIEIRIVVTGGGSLTICHSVTHGDSRHQKSCCWELQVQAEDRVVRWANLLVP